MSGIDELRGICRRWAAHHRMGQQTPSVDQDFYTYCRRHGYDVVWVSLAGGTLRSVTAWSPTGDLVTTTVHG